MRSDTPDRYTLRFPSPLVEAAFQADYVRRSLWLVRIALVLGLLQFAAFGMLDRVMVPESFQEVQRLRYTACAVVALVIAFTFTPLFRKTAQAATSVAPLAIGLAISAFVYVAQQTNGYYDYYAGLILVLVYVHVLIRLRFVVASAVGAVLIAAYVGVTVHVGTPGVLVLNDAFFLLSANSTGMVASYVLELYARRDWAHARRQGETNAELAAALGGLRTAQDRLVQQEKMASLGRLTAGIAHEIKNPLNFVNNFAGLSADLVAEVRSALAADPDRPARAVLDEVGETLADLSANADKIGEHGRRADRIVQAMQRQARGGAGDRTPTDLAALLQTASEAALEAYRDRSPGTRVELDRAIDADLGECLVMPEGVGQAVVNLLDNAFWAADHTAAGTSGDGADAAPPVVSLTARRRRGRTGDAVEVRVEDRGPGIDAATRARVFEPFFTTKPAGQGTGLGLSFTYDIVVAGHGGTIAVESAEGAGTTFVVTLPIEPAGPAAAEPEPGRPAGTRAAPPAASDPVPG